MEKDLQGSISRVVRIIAMYSIWLIIGSGDAHADPDWCENTPKHDGTYRNYVGRATGSTLDQAFREAVMQARKEAVEENFGFQFHVTASANLRDDLRDEQAERLLTQDYEERSRSARLEGFERVDSFSAGEGGKGTFSACVWFRYPVSAIAAEKERLSGLKGRDSLTRGELVIQGSEDDSRRGVVIIQTVPPGAQIRIDGRSWGETPIELRGKLSSGKHYLVLDHPKFARKTKEFGVYEGATVRIDEILKKATAQVKIETEPSGARVMLQGRYVGDSPIGPIEVTAGEPIMLTIDHPEAKHYERKIELERNELWDQKVALELKQAHLSFMVEPKDAVVDIDGKTAKGLNYDIDLSAGEHDIHLSRDGFESVSQSTTLKGGEALDLGLIRMAMQRMPPPSQPGPYSLAPSLGGSALDRTPASTTEVSPESLRLLSPNWYFDFSLGGATSPIQNPDISLFRMGLSLEYFPYWLFGVRFAYLLGIGMENYSGGTLDFFTNTFEVGVPIHFLWPHLLGNDSIFIEPKASIALFSYAVVANGSSNSNTTPTHSIASTGVNIGYRILGIPSPDASKVYGVTFRGGEDRNQRATGGFQAQASYNGSIELNIGW